MMTAAHSLASAWTERYTAAATALQRAENAPGLFEPEHVAHLRDEAERAERQCRFWLGQVRA